MPTISGADPCSCATGMASYWNSSGTSTAGTINQNVYTKNIDAVSVEADLVSCGVLTVNGQDIGAPLANITASGTDTSVNGDLDVNGTLSVKNSTSSDILIVNPETPSITTSANITANGNININPSTALINYGSAPIYPTVTLFRGPLYSTTLTEVTSIPSWVNKIEITYTGISFATAGQYLSLQLGGVSYQTANYVNSASYMQSATATSVWTISGTIKQNSFYMAYQLGASKVGENYTGRFVLEKTSSSNHWVGSSLYHINTGTGPFAGWGSHEVLLTEALSKIRITSHNVVSNDMSATGIKISYTN